MNKLSVIFAGFLYSLSYYFMVGKGYFGHTNSFMLFFMGLLYYLVLLLWQRYRSKKLSVNLMLRNTPQWIKTLWLLTLFLVFIGQCAITCFHFANASTLYLYPSNTLIVMIIMLLSGVFVIQFLKWESILLLFRRFAIYVFIVFMVIISMFISYYHKPMVIISDITLLGTMEALSIVIMNSYLLILLKKEQMPWAIMGNIIGLVVLSIIFFINEQVFGNLNNSFIYSTIMLGNTFEGISFILNIDILIGCAFLLIECFKLIVIFRVLNRLYIMTFNNHRRLCYFMVLFIVMVFSLCLIINSEMIALKSFELLISILSIFISFIFLLII